MVASSFASPFAKAWMQRGSASRVLTRGQGTAKAIAMM